MAVTFFLSGEPDLASLATLDPDADQLAFRRGERVWVLQTYLRLAAAGHPVRLAGEAPPDGIIVFHAKQHRALYHQRHRLRDALLVAVRADNREEPMGDVEVVQNGRWADGRRRFFVPHWPQPGLIPRDPARGATVRRIAFKGFADNLHPAFRSEAWREKLRERGLAWHCDAVPFEATRRLGCTAWHDYSTTDVVVAVRPDHIHHTTGKPASKLVNAWLAGVPALLGPEYAYRELRRSPLDYLEVSGPDEALAAIGRLVTEPGLYAAMVANGRRRAGESSSTVVTARWASLLFDTLPALAEARRRRIATRVPVAFRRPLRSVARVLALRPAR